MNISNIFLRSSLRLASSFFLALIISASVAAQNFQHEDVNITTPSGYRIAGTYYSISGQTGPAVLLLPNITGQRGDWNDFLPILQDSGVKSVLAIDLPGSGSSDFKNRDKISWRNFTEEDFRDISTELNSALDHLRQAPTTDPAHIGIIGSILGANYAAVMAANNSDIKSLVLLSPGLVYRSVASFWAMEKYPNKPVLLVATKTDYYSVRSCEKMREGKSQNIQFQIYNKPAYGTDILANNPSFKATLTDWLKSNL